LLLKEGKTEEAKAKFAQARELDANVAFGENFSFPRAGVGTH
jgi:hypothetical protein